MDIRELGFAKKKIYFQQPRIEFNFVVKELLDENLEREIEC